MTHARVLSCRLTLAITLSITWSTALLGLSACSSNKSDNPSGDTAGTTVIAGSGGVGAGSAGTLAGSAGVNAGSSAGSAGTTAGSIGSAGAAGTSAGTSAGAGGTSAPGQGCALTSDHVRITEIDVGVNVTHNEDEAALMPLVISPMATSGSRVAFMSSDSKLHIVQLDASDAITGSPTSLPAHDFSDLYADDSGGTVLLTRDAQGAGTLNCGEPTNLCGTPPQPAIPCYDMYMARFDGATETWATKLTSSSAQLPPYSTAKTGAEVYMIWWYAHHGRIAFDGTHYAGYYGVAISVSQAGCINIHQGDRMSLVGMDGALDPQGGFGLGCSHSGYERVVWDATANKLVTVCKTDNMNRIAFAPNYTTIYPVDLAYSNLGNVVIGKSGGYWLPTSIARAGQPAMQDGLADVHLLHFVAGAADQDLALATDAALNVRAPHLAAYGANAMLAAWETSTSVGDLRENDANRKLYLQALDASNASKLGDALPVPDVRGNRYQDLRAFPDGSVAYAAPGSSATRIKILRVLPCTP